MLSSSVVRIPSNKVMFMDFMFYGQAEIRSLSVSTPPCPAPFYGLRRNSNGNYNLNHSSDDNLLTGGLINALH